jgi:hypothetical protein
MHHIPISCASNHSRQTVVAAQRARVKSIFPTMATFRTKTSDIVTQFKHDAEQ